MIGTTVGSYQITSKVSIGGMGTVYKAEHTLIGRHAAVKVLHPELTTNKDIVNRFFNEAKATTRIKHPGIVEVFDFGYLPSGHAYLVMEFLEGMSLARRLKMRGRIGEGEAAMMLRSVCSALGAAHAKGIVHRDLKPDNIFLVPDPESATGERPKLLDFGIAKLTDVGLAGSATKTGAVMGTPTYMSPEQCRGTGEVDLRADLYSIGCILYELVAARPPFTNLGAGELIGAHLFMQPDPPSMYQPGISAETEQLIMALLAKKPELRPQTAKELGQRLSMIAHRQGWITATTPNGITAESLRELNNARRAHDLPEAHDHTVPSQPPKTTPITPSPSRMPSPIHTPGPPSAVGPPSVVEPPRADEPMVAEPPSIAEQPTTLSGAASQSVVDVPRSRRGIAAIGIAVVAAAGIVFGVMFLGGERGESKPATAPVAAPHPVAVPPKPAPPASSEPPAPVPEPAKPEPAKAEPPKPDPAKPEPPKPPEPVAEPTPPPAPPTPPPVKAKTVPRTKPATPATKKLDKKPGLPIETDIE